METIDHHTLCRGEQVILKIGNGYYLDTVVQVTKRPADTIILKDAGFFMSGSRLEIYKSSKKNKTLLMLQDIPVEKEED